MTELSPKMIAYLLSLNGWCPEDKMQRLYKLVMESKPEIVVELGVWAGRSLFPMALALKEIGKGKAYGFDAFSNKVATEGTNNPADDEWWQKVDMAYIMECLEKSITFLFLRDWIIWAKSKTDTASKVFRDNSVDIIHQDSAHNVETITAELNLWVPKLKAGGYWIADDCDWDKAKEGYAKLPEHGLILIEDYQKWQIWKKK